MADITNVSDLATCDCTLNRQFENYTLVNPIHVAAITGVYLAAGTEYDTPQVGCDSDPDTPRVPIPPADTTILAVT